MCATRIALLCLFLGIRTANMMPSLVVVNRSYTSSCSKNFLVAGADNVTFEADVSGNNSAFTFGILISPEFNRLLSGGHRGTSKFLCSPFGVAKRFCDSKPSHGCTCKVIGRHVYRVKNVYTVTGVDESRGKIVLIWRSRNDSITVQADIPEVKANVNLIRSVKQQCLQPIKKIEMTPVPSHKTRPPHKKLPLLPV
ncbi:hypothetical protein PoB_004260400 [Plakobranchus ocellatus]|uniref:Reelin domain-containing protein n=1 Tax=Plakobranchus ocellatus TaxID=259542 RepID=A0AAV4B7R4_9GAST|nr:hypothetical protein PoB_004260400 [Plakobranchus ocellatus]